MFYFPAYGGPHKIIKHINSITTCYMARVRQKRVKQFGEVVPAKSEKVI